MMIKMGVVVVRGGQQVVRPLLQYYCFRRRRVSLTTFSFPLLSPLLTSCPRPAGVGCREMRTRAGLAAYERTSYYSSGDEDEDDNNKNKKKSRNEKKREAKRALKWGVDLASFSTTQIKRILKVASLEPEVFEAIMLVKRLGRDVREGKRRQFSYIGRLLREAEPKLMDGLIAATKDADQNKFQAVCNSAKTLISGDEDEDDEDDLFEEIDSNNVDEDSHEIMEKASRWFDGLMNKDVEIGKEIYTLQDVDFDRQELRRLVRQLQTMRERQIDSEDNQEGVDKAIIDAERSLSRFLRNLVQQLELAQDSHYYSVL